MQRKDILQIGTGNFLRGFSCWMVQKMIDRNLIDSKVHMVQTHGEKLPQAFADQGNKFHVLEQGLENGSSVSRVTLIDCVKEAINANQEPEAFYSLAENPNLKFVISNTTEAGIVFEKEERPKIGEIPNSFPAKMTAFMFYRFNQFEGNPDKGLIFLPCELIENNAAKLKEYMLKHAENWEMPLGFLDWIKSSNHYCNTLVDRIVPGMPKEDYDEIRESIGFDDKLLVKTEPFHFWAIEGGEKVREEFPADQAGMNVVFTSELEPYRKRKVKILNGAHTALVPLAYLQGFRTVRESVENEEIEKFLKDMISEEIIPTLDMNKNELESFAEDVLERFKNPFVHHELLSIALNSISKFKVRLLPTLLEYREKSGKWPDLICLSFAKLLVFNSGMDLEGSQIPLQDNPDYVLAFKEAWKNDTLEGFLNEVLSNKEMWGIDLSEMKGLKEQIVLSIDFEGHKKMLKNRIQKN